jgi:hypothetical protein
LVLGLHPDKGQWLHNNPVQGIPGDQLENMGWLPAHRAGMFGKMKPELPEIRRLKVKFVSLLQV